MPSQMCLQLSECQYMKQLIDLLLFIIHPYTMHNAMRGWGDELLSKCPNNFPFLDRILSMPIFKLI